MQNEEKDNICTSLTAGEGVSVSASDAASHAAPTFTPGPWFVCHTNFISYVKADTGHKEIAVLYADAGAEKQANAHLISAAPELYEALKAYVTACEQQAIKLGPITGSAKAAIAKAEGR